jgi:hypothetical protein
MKRLSWVSLAALSACGGAEPAPRPVVAVAEPQVERPALTTEAPVGALDPYAVEESFKSLYREVERCLASGSARLEALGGQFTLRLKISGDGAVGAAYMKSSTLGDRVTETCILDAARARSWPRPLGGDGDAEHTFEVDATAPVNEWNERRLRSVKKTIYRKVARCVSPLRGRWSATLYVRGDGRVAAAGVAPPSAHGEQEQADCLVDVLRGFQFGRQRQRISKVTFTIP